MSECGKWERREAVLTGVFALLFVVTLIFGITWIPIAQLGIYSGIAWILVIGVLVATGVILVILVFEHYQGVKACRGL